MKNNFFALGDEIMIEYLGVSFSGTFIQTQDGRYGIKRQGENGNIYANFTSFLASERIQGIVSSIVRGITFKVYDIENENGYENVSYIEAHETFQAAYN